ncbi:hypothetical protein [Methylophaga nitratireducenticrescens]|uniref:hypothetical protein n=1 Tax=Methylophaga nitratireducenticrescens TaxID=754476 RepID=UPI000CDBC965|nr:hypothetical protein [Methylophaga nitratireducenticrescens]AUZ83791.1 hypothetical protein CDW43_04040 [Methylophaga nitratireducenticrescens]
MGYIDTLLETRDNVNKGELPTNNKMILIELIEKEVGLVNAQVDPFVHFYTDVLGISDIFDFSAVLEQNYALAQQHADACISIFINFASLEPTSKLHSWLQSAIRFVDCIVIHYLQEVLSEDPLPQGDAGVERSRYIQINRQGVKAQKAGRIMDNLYDQRNQMEHATKSDPKNPNKQLLLTPNYRRAIRQINKRFPEALESFNEARL